MAEDARLQAAQVGALAELREAVHAVDARARVGGDALEAGLRVERGDEVRERREAHAEASALQLLQVGAQLGVDGLGRQHGVPTVRVNVIWPRARAAHFFEKGFENSEI